MKRIVTVHVKHPDGSEQDLRHESADNPVEFASFITGITDDQPGTEVVFTVKSEREPHDRR